VALDRTSLGVGDSDETPPKRMTTFRSVKVKLIRSGLAPDIGSDPMTKITTSRPISIIIIIINSSTPSRRPITNRHYTH